MENEMKGEREYAHVVTGRLMVVIAILLLVVICVSPVLAAGNDADWTLSLKGATTKSITKAFFEQGLACPSSGHQVFWTDTEGNRWGGVPLWLLAGMVDDNPDIGPDHYNFNDGIAAQGYSVKLTAGDGLSKEFVSTAIARNNNIIVANTLNGQPLSFYTSSEKPSWPLHLKGSALTGSQHLGNITSIELTGLPQPSTTIPDLHIIKYAADGTTILSEKIFNYAWMERNLAIIGDGTTTYKFEGLTGNPANLWDPEETYPGGYKISNVVKGSRVRDLVELVGGMGSGTTITFVGSDGFETTLPYSSIYTNPAVQARQGDAVLAWWGDGAYVPAYEDGMRLFFMPSDHVYGQWDMHETLPSKYWRYNSIYPSAAGLSAKYVTTIKVYSLPETDYTLELDGRDIGGISYTVGKPLLEEAVACTHGAEHKATYTDSSGNVWEGMPLWFFAGFVDDTDQHSAEAYNETKTLAGYNIIISDNEGNSVTIDSQDTLRNSNYIIANSLNGFHIPDTDESFPLRLTGAGVSERMTVKKVAKIQLVKAGAIPTPEFPTLAFPIMVIGALAFVVYVYRRE
jgi:hypothetical protein